MEFNGLPLHPLVVHAAVIFGPLSALFGLAYVAIRRWRDRLRWPTLALVLIALGSIWMAYLSGQNFFESSRFDGFTGEAVEKIEKHMDYARTLRLVVTGYAIVTVLATWLHERTGALRIVLSVLMVLGAIGTLVYSALTGDAGAQAVWGS